LDEPGQAEDEDADHGNDLGDEGDGLILDLSEGAGPLSRRRGPDGGRPEGDSA
jgi:hypothetical protein